MIDKTERLKQLIAQSQRIVFFGGAGVSTASGIPDFRSSTGLYNQKNNLRYSPETILSHSFFIKHPREFYDYHLSHLVAQDAQPNPAHHALAELEKQGKLSAIITQNIDGLHQQAGSANVIELHGNAFNFYCVNCHKNFDLAYVLSRSSVPACSHCRGLVRPNIVLYEEALDPTVIEDAIEALRQADLLIVGGTSLVVYPAAGLIDYYRGRELVLINRECTAYDSQASLLIHGDIAEVLKAAVF